MHCTGSALGIGTDRTGNWKKWSCRDGGEHFLIKYCCCGAVIIIWFPDVDLFLYFLQPATCYINLCVASSNRGGSLGWHKTSSGCLLQCFSSHVVRALEHCGSDQNYFRLSGKYILIVNKNGVSWNTDMLSIKLRSWSLVSHQSPITEVWDLKFQIPGKGML